MISQIDGRINSFSMISFLSVNGVSQHLFQPTVIEKAGSRREKKKKNKKKMIRKMMKTQLDPHSVAVISGDDCGRQTCGSIPASKKGKTKQD